TLVTFGRIVADETEIHSARCTDAEISVPESLIISRAITRTTVVSQLIGECASGPFRGESGIHQRTLQTKLFVYQRAELRRIGGAQRFELALNFVQAPPNLQSDERAGGPFDLLGGEVLVLFHQNRG